MRASESGEGERVCEERREECAWCAQRVREEEGAESERRRAEKERTRPESATLCVCDRGRERERRYCAECISARV